MTFFESSVALLLAAIVLLQISRRFSLPYPAMLATAGIVVASIPGSPVISFDPDTALALFVAPSVAFAAFNFSPRSMRRFWRPLVSLAFFAVVITTALVAWIGWKFIGLPAAAAVALGAIVAPPDAAAAAAVLRSVSIPRSTKVILKGESLFNDATTLLLFSFAISVLSHGALTPGVSLRLALAVPGGLLLGVVCALILRGLSRFVRNTLGGNLLQFVMAFMVWILAQHFQVSAVLCTIAFAMTMARTAKSAGMTRMRVQSYAVWSAVVFSLNVFAFLLMGLQGRAIVTGMPLAHLKGSLAFAAVVVVAVVVARLTVALSLSRLNAWWERSHGRPEPAGWGQAVFVGWSGMRGFVTLATAFALPASFPQRDLVVLTAFSVVVATLVLQGFTLTPLIRWLKLNEGEVVQREVAEARISLTKVALAALAEQTGPEIEHLRLGYLVQRDTSDYPSGSHYSHGRNRVGLAAILAEREELERLQKDDLVGEDSYLVLREQLDWKELTLLGDEERWIEES